MEKEDCWSTHFTIHGEQLGGIALWHSTHSLPEIKEVENALYIDWNNQINAEMNHNCKTISTHVFNRLIIAPKISAKLESYLTVTQN